MTVYTHSNLIVLPEWETRPLIGTMTQFPTQSHYPDTERTNHCPLPVMPSTSLSSDIYQLCESLVWLEFDSNSRTSTLEACALAIQPLRPVVWTYGGRYNIYLNWVIRHVQSWNIEGITPLPPNPSSQHVCLYRSVLKGSTSSPTHRAWDYQFWCIFILIN